MRRAISCAAVLFGLVGLVGLAGGVAGCFSPRRPACAFSCVEKGLCPTGYVCATDGLCHRDDGVGICTLEPLDGASDGAGMQDGGAGGGPDRADGGQDGAPDGGAP